MASLLDFLSSGVRVNGSPVSGGTARFYIPGTLTPTAVYSDSDGTAVYAQPVTLGADGQATVYTNGQVRCIVYNSSGSNVLDLGLAGTEVATEIQVANANFTGTDLDTVLTAAATSLGGKDWGYKQASTAARRNIKDWLGQLVISVKDYGAAGDNLQDDTTYIQAAIAAVVTLGGGIVFFPKGTYKLTAALTVASRGVSFLGVGWRGSSKSKLSQATTNVNCITFTDGGSGFIRGISFDCATTSTGTAIAINGSDNIVIEGCEVAATVYATGIAIAAGAGTPTYITIKDSTVYGSTNAITASAGQFLWFKDCTFGTTGTIAVSITGTTTALVYFIGCYYVSATADSLKINTTVGASGGSTFVVIGNIFNRSGTNDINIVTTGDCGLIEYGNRAIAAGIPVKLVIADASTLVSSTYGTYGYHANGFHGTQAKAVIAATNSFTPDCSQGNEFQIDVSGAATTLTINAPTNDGPLKARGGSIRVWIQVTGGAAIVAVAWNATFKVVLADVNLTNGNTTILDFEWDGVNYREICAKTTAT